MNAVNALWLMNLMIADNRLLWDAGVRDSKTAEIMK